MILYAVAGFEGAPYLIERAVRSYDARTPGRSLAVTRVVVNPFSMVVRLDGFAFRDLNAGIGLAANSVRVDFSLMTLVSGRVVLDELTVDGGRLQAASAQWRAKLGRLLDGLAVRVAERRPALRIIRLQLANGRLDLGTPGAADDISLHDISLTCAAAADGGRLRLSGAQAAASAVNVPLSERAALSAATLKAGFDGRVAARSSGFTVRADLTLHGTGLRIANATMPDAAALRLTKFSAKAQARYASGAGRITGDAGGEGFVVKAAGADGGGFSADRVAAFALTVSGEPAAVDIDRVQLDGLAGTIDIAPLAQPTLPDWLRRAVDPYAANSAGAPPLVLGRVEISDGTLDLTDSSMDPEPSLRLRHLKGTVDGLRRGDETAAVDLQAALGESGSATVSGRLRPFAPNGFSEIEIRADGADAASLSPYARRFAGRVVRSGRLSADLKYRISDRQLDGLARVSAHQLTLTAAQNRAAAPLPLPLAVALLDDPQGNIDLTVPLHAQLDRPDPYLPALLGNALGRAITGTANEPFAVLARVVGADSDSLQAVPFDPGSAAITATAKSNLTALAAGLAQRPGLAVTVAGGYERGADGKALATQEVRLHVALATASAAQFSSAQLGEPPPLDFKSPRVQSVLDEFAGQRLGTDRIEAIAARFPTAAGAKGAAREPYYHALFDALVARQSISDQALQRLGRYRAQAVIDTLTGLGVGAGRVERTGVPAPVAAQGGEASVAVPLGLRALQHD